jgi:membrane-bound lytic murein transglycosylase B
MKKYIPYVIGTFVASSSLLGLASFASAAEISHPLALRGHAWGFHFMKKDPSNVSQKADHLEKMASLFGISAQDLQNRLSQGKTIGDVIKDLGISPEQTQEKMKAEHAKHLEEMKAAIQKQVQEGKLTQAEAEKRLAHLEHPPRHGLGKHGLHPRGPFTRPKHSR